MTTLEILRTGPLALVQDLGRVGRGGIEKTPPRLPLDGVIKPATTYFPAVQYHRRPS